MTKEQEIVGYQAQQGLLCFDKGQLTKEELEVVMGICFETGELTKDWDNSNLREIIMYLCDKELVTEDVVRKCLFNLPPKKR